MPVTIQDRIGALPWGARGLLLVAACLAVTVVSPVMRYSCARSPSGDVGCLVSSHALGLVPFAWTRIERVADADSEFVPGGQDRSRRGRPIVVSEAVNRILGDGQTQEWTTYASIGADPGSLAIAIDELVAGVRRRPLLAWQANAGVAVGVFPGALPFAAAMIGRSLWDSLGLPPERRLAAIERTYLAALLLGLAGSFALFWGSIPEPLAVALGLPTG